MSLVSQATRQALLLLRKGPFQLPISTVATIPSDQILDEERRPGYNSESFYPAKPGEILAEKYQLLTKVGWGVGSTVWLARNINRFRWQYEENVVLKIMNSSYSRDTGTRMELEKLIATKNSSHPGYGFVRPCRGHFEIAHKEKKHTCQIYDPMRETMEFFQRRWPERRMPLVVAKAYIQVLLHALDYLHTECEIVHTDLKLSNFLMTAENDNVLPGFIERYVINQPLEYKTNPETNCNVYSSYTTLGDLEVKDIHKMLPKIADFDSSMRPDYISPEDKAKGLQAVFTHPIQANYYRAPEVVLGYGWTFSTDIWNFGVLVWNIIEGTELFTQVVDEERNYNPKSHVAEMIALLGPPPKQILERIENMKDLQCSEGGPISTSDGTTGQTAREHYGVHFDENGNFLHEELIPQRKLEDTIPSIPDDEKELFLSFARDMLTWQPRERKTARELIKHPFLHISGQAKDL